MSKKIQKVTFHAGHNPKGKIACGASDYIDESTENRVITKKCVSLAKKNSIKAYNCTVDNGKNQNDVLYKIKAKIEKITGVDLNVSIHFNAYVHSTKDGKTKGVEVCVKPVSGDDKNYTKTKATMKYKVAKKICNCISALGFSNRGVSFRDNLYILNQTSKPTILVEVCFVDDADDVALYKKNKDNVARAIIKGITGYNSSL